jgi:hypothetical protein
MTKSRSKKTSPSTVTTEPDWVAADEGDASADPAREMGVEREPNDEPDPDVYQPGPDEPVWTPVEPEVASEAASANEAPAATPKRTRRSKRAGGAPNKPAQFDADAAAHEPTDTFDPNQQAKPSMEPVAKRRRARKGVEQQPPAVIEPPSPELDAPITSDATDAPADAATEPASPLQSMEEYIAELGRMSVPELAKRHVEMLGKAPRIKNRTWLQRKLA